MLHVFRMSKHLPDRSKQRLSDRQAHPAAARMKTRDLTGQPALRLFLVTQWNAGTESIAAITLLTPKTCTCQRQMVMAETPVRSTR